MDRTRRSNPFCVRPSSRVFHQPNPYNMEHLQEMYRRQQPDQEVQEIVPDQLPVMQELVPTQLQVYQLQPIEMPAGQQFEANPPQHFVVGPPQQFDAPYPPEIQTPPPMENNENASAAGDSPSPGLLPNVGSSLKQDRINRCLSRVKPKSSPVILKEVYKTVAYEYASDGEAYLATVVVEGSRHIGRGRTKAAAQAAAADLALRQMVMRSFDQHQPAAPLSHGPLLSHALFKLLNGWDPSGSMTARMQCVAPSRRRGLVQPSRRFPDNPELMHPVMLLSQTHPMARYRLLSTSTLPSISYTMQCTVEDDFFTGVGPNKKAAKRLAAMQACEELLGIQYPGNQEN